MQRPPGDVRAWTAYSFWPRHVGAHFWIRRGSNKEGRLPRGPSAQRHIQRLMTCETQYIVCHCKRPGLSEVSGVQEDGTQIPFNWTNHNSKVSRVLISSDRGHCLLCFLELYLHL